MMTDSVKSTQYIAYKILNDFDGASSIDTANYQMCGFIFAAAKVAMENEEFANLIAQKMPEPR